MVSGQRQGGCVARVVETGVAGGGAGRYRLELRATARVDVVVVAMEPARGLGRTRATLLTETTHEGSRRSWAARASRAAPWWRWPAPPIT